MPDWAAGYVLDIQYTAGFYRELAPSFLRLVAMSRSVRPPQLSEGAAYCELGCGQGFGTLLLAASNPAMRFWGFDFNPAQIFNARRLAAEAKITNVSFEDSSFEQLALAPADAYPMFDAITLHGIYSWITEENRHFIVDIIAKRLKPGGVVYVSYNSMPGWAHLAPLQRLLREHADRAPGRSDTQVMNALKFAEMLQKGGARYFSANPQVGVRLEKLVSMNQNYLAHEYLNGSWHPMYHSEVAKEMEGARLRYVGAANLADNVDAVAVPPDLQKEIAAVSDPAWAETLRDFIANRQFRKDVFMRGASEVTGQAAVRALGSTPFYATVPRSAFKLKFTGPLGELTGQPELYDPVADALSERPRTLFELAKLPCFETRGFAAASQVVMMLVHAGYVHPGIGDYQERTGEAARRVNRTIMERFRVGEAFGFLAAPAIGSAVPVGFSNLLVLTAWTANPKAPHDVLCRDCLALLRSNNQRLVQDGTPIVDDEPTLAALGPTVETVLRDLLPLWKKLGAI